MTTDTNKNFAAFRDARDTTLAALLNAAENLVTALRALQRRTAQVRLEPHLERHSGGSASLSSVADDRLRQLDAAVVRGDVTPEDVQDLRDGYERVRTRDQAGLPSLDLTY